MEIIYASQSDPFDRWWLIALPILLMLILVLFQIYVIQESIEDKALRSEILQKQLWKTILNSAAISGTLMICILMFIWWNHKSVSLPSAMMLDTETPIDGKISMKQTEKNNADGARPLPKNKIIKSVNFDDDVVDSGNNAKTASVTSRKTDSNLYIDNEPDYKKRYAKSDTSSTASSYDSPLDEMSESQTSVSDYEF